ncbi:hypothetical protein MWU60_15975 [Yoonia sp. F2084L]|uniref:hypothetical protein n=1 Tax=Yoonia sp. F2084L TaxID=2926419 RepID=UPI001FF67FEA|nr:hypothetical protein [Yoonia sp. F2084L]MCK0097076.1 hypothetical protein [Yoonia sp. F2084L]
MSFIDPEMLRPHTAALKETLQDLKGRVYPLGTEAKIVLLILAVVAIWGFAIVTFGVPALVWPMKLIVPGLILSLVLLTWGM